MQHHHFDSGHQLKALLDKQGYAKSLSSFGDAYTLRQGANLLVEGETNTHALQAINALVDQFQEAISVPVRAQRASVRGHRVNIGAYLSGSPLNMVQRALDTSDHTPLRIYIGTNSSSSLSNDLLAKRAAGLAAFALALSKHRPVILTSYCLRITMNQLTESSVIISLDMSTNPLYISELAAHFDPRITRQIMHHASHILSPSISLSCMPTASEAQTRVWLNAKADDIILQGASYDDPLIHDPIPWIKDQIARYTITND